MARGSSSPRKKTNAPKAKWRSRALPSSAGVRKATPRTALLRTRKIDAAQRRQSILDAALTVFAERGFAPARLDDVAAAAGVAKGTLYLYFKDKESLFEAVIRNAAAPLIEHLQALSNGPPVSIDAALEMLAGIFESEVLRTRRKLVVRLVISEGPRFPRIAKYHYDHVVSPVMALISKLTARARRRGEISSDALERFPQLVIAPLLTALLWDALFATIKPLDIPQLLKAHRQMLVSNPRRGRS